jgi:hypothetical protein
MQVFVALTVLCCKPRQLQDKAEHQEHPPGQMQQLGDQRFEPNSLLG